MPNRKSIYDSLRFKMEEVGFQFELEQMPHHQNLTETELKFVHAQLINKWEKEGYNVRAQKFYLKALSNSVDSEIGLVTGKSSPLLMIKNFESQNSRDSFDGNPAWTNRDGDPVLDRLLKSIKDYLDFPDN